MFNFIPPFDETRLRAAANEALDNGKPVIVNTTGTVSAVTGASGSQSIGTENTLKTTTSKNFSICYDSNSDRFVACFDGDSNEGMAVVIDVAPNNFITHGTPVKFGDSNGETTIAAVFDSNSNRVVIGYRDQGNSNNATGIVGSVDPSDNSIAFGTKAQWSTGNPTYLHGVFDTTNNKAVFIYNDGANNEYGTRVVGTVDPSDNSISFGSVVVWNSARTRYLGSSYVPDRNKIITAYTQSTGVNQLVVFRVNGTSTNAVTGPTAAGGNNSWRYPSLAYDTLNDVTLLTFRDGDGTVKTFSVVITVDSDGAATLGTAAEFTSTQGTYIATAYSETARSFMVAYKAKNGTTNSNDGVFKTVTIDGTTPSFSSEILFADAETNYIAVASNPDQEAQFCLAFEDDDNSDRSKAIGITVAFSNTNLTSENYIGISNGSVTHTGSAATLGSSLTFENAEIGSTSTGIAFDSNSNRIVIAYKDAGNSNYGTAIVGTVSSTSITFGTAEVFASAASKAMSATFDSNSNKVVIIFQDDANSDQATGIVGTVDPSDNSISFGSETVCGSSIGQCENIDSCFDSNSNKVVTTMRDNSGPDGDEQRGRAYVGTVSGTSISFGTPAEFEADNANLVKCEFDSSSNKVVVIYREGASAGNGRAKVGTVSGTDISFGNEATFKSGDVAGGTTISYDSVQNKFLVSYKVGGTSSVVVGTVSGTDISFGTEVKTLDTINQYSHAAYSPDTGAHVIVYRSGDSDKGKYIPVTISGTTPSVIGTAVEYDPAGIANVVVYDANADKFVVAWGNGSIGQAVVFEPDSRVATRGQVGSGSSASVDIIGTVSENQTSLTAGQQYFVQIDGTLGETADDPSVFAGTAINSTSLIVKT